MTYPPQQPNPAYGGGPPQWQPGGGYLPAPNYSGPPAYGQPSPPAQWGAPQQPGYGAQQPGYGAQPSSYGAPAQQPMYGPPQQPPNYGNQPNGSWQPGPPKKSQTGLILAVVAVLVVVGGGLGVYFGVIKKNTGTSTGTASVSGPFGDINTLDPCGFVSSDTFADSNTDVHIQPEDLAACEVKLEMHDIKGGYTVDISLSNHVADSAKLADSSQYTVTSAGSLHIAKKAERSGSAFNQCERSVYQDDLVGVTIYGSVVGDATDSSGAARTGYDACKPADQAVTAVVAAVSGRGLPRIAYSKDSLGSIDMCGTVTAAQVNSALNTTGIQMLPRSTHEACYFPASGSAGLPRVRVQAALNTPNAWNNGQSIITTQTTVAGRKTAIYSDDSSTVGGHKDTMCSAQTAIKTWSSWPGRTAVGGSIAVARATSSDVTAGSTSLVELASVEVTMPGGTASSQCTAAAQNLAAAIWPKLPPATS